MPHMYYTHMLAFAFNPLEGCNSTVCPSLNEWLILNRMSTTFLLLTTFIMPWLMPFMNHSTWYNILPRNTQMALESPHLFQVHSFNPHSFLTVYVITVLGSLRKLNDVKVVRPKHLSPQLFIILNRIMNRENDAQSIIFWLPLSPR